jgi:hypothetical protein
LLRVEQGSIVDGGRKVSRAGHHHCLDASFDYCLDASIQRLIITEGGHQASASIFRGGRRVEPPC